MSSTKPLPLVLDSLIGQNVGGYLVEEVLGEGGMGLVYRARHPLLNRHFAVKVLRPEIAADATSSGNFVREAQTLSSLKHPGIIDIVGFGPLNDGRQYMVMEFLEGRTLEAELVEQGRMYPDRALKLADEILDALSAAHSVDVIHRDLKPSNVFLAKVSGGREVIKLLDFGLAKQQPVAILGTSVVSAAGASVIAGTPEYIAPEQARGRPASKQSDLYSFGVMFFEMLTGSLPFQPDNQLTGEERIRKLLLKHTSQPAPTIHDSATDVHFPEGLGDAVADLLKKTPEERPSSAETVRKRLQKVFRSLQQEATQQRANPLLMPPLSAQPPSTDRSPVVRLAQTDLGNRAEFSPTADQALSRAAPLRRWRRVVGLLLMLLIPLGWLLWPRPPPPAAPTLMGESLPPRVQPEPEAEAPPPVLAPPVVVKPALIDPELAPLKPRPIQPKTGPAVKVEAPSCDPDDAWKKGARATLNELLARAATMSPDVALRAADRDREISALIGLASTGNECGTVDAKLAALNRELKEP